MIGGAEGGRSGGDGVFARADTGAGELGVGKLLTLRKFWIVS
jgi:hypothetical protein